MALAWRLFLALVAAKLKNKGYIPTISSKDLGEKGVWFRV